MSGIPSPFRYAIYKDPAGWLNINPINGTVDTTAVLDRESPFVHNSVYTALFLAIDSGESLSGVFVFLYVFSDTCVECSWRGEKWVGTEKPLLPAILKLGISHLWKGKCVHPGVRAGVTVF